MRQIENFDFDPQNKIRICCLARSLQARSLRQQLTDFIDILKLGGCDNHPDPLPMVTTSLYQQ
jgi:hypothetical protein